MPVDPRERRSDEEPRRMGQRRARSAHFVPIPAADASPLAPFSVDCSTAVAFPGQCGPVPLPSESADSRLRGATANVPTFAPPPQREAPSAPPPATRALFADVLLASSAPGPSQPRRYALHASPPPLVMPSSTPCAIQLATGNGTHHGGAAAAHTPLHIQGSTPMLASGPSANTLERAYSHEEMSGEPEEAPDVLSGGPFLFEDNDLCMGTADQLGEPFEFL